MEVSLLAVGFPFLFILQQDAATATGGTDTKVSDEDAGLHTLNSVQHVPTARVFLTTNTPQSPANKLSLKGIIANNIKQPTDTFKRRYCSSQSLGIAKIPQSVHATRCTGLDLPFQRDFACPQHRARSFPAVSEEPVAVAADLDPFVLC